jgi:hypothetical protein
MYVAMNEKYGRMHLMPPIYNTDVAYTGEKRDKYRFLWECQKERHH